MVKKILNGAFVVCLVAPFSMYSQAQSLDFSKLNPNVVAAFNCAGMITGSALNNMDLGVYSEQRARNMAQGATLYSLAVAVDETNQDHINSHGHGYDVAYQNALEDIVDLLAAGNFTWEAQGQLDNCISRMVGVLSSPYPSGLDTYEERKPIIDAVNERFDYLMQLVEAVE